MDKTRKSNFYMILPSNGSPLTRPENTASAYITDFSTPIILDDNWEVALMEYSFEYVERTIPVWIKSTVGPEKVHVVNFWYENDRILDGKILPESFLWTHLGGPIMNSYIYFNLVGNEMTITCEKAFKVSVKSNPKLSDKAHKLIYEEKEYKHKHVYTILADIENLYDLYLNFRPESEKIIELEKFPVNSGSLQLTEYINKYCSEIFEKFTIDQNNIVSFTIKPNFFDIEFHPDLARMLGLKTVFFAPGSYSSEIIPNNRQDQIYIYSNVTDNILVGGSQVPLLKSIWIDSKYKKGDIVNGVMKHPMYLPTSLNSINKVEVNIRSDSGELIPFPYGSKSSLTLHFRQN